MKNVQKKFNQYEVKTFGSKVKDIDDKTRRVKIMLAHFDNIDSDGDVIRMGSFAKSILERGPNSTSNRKIAFLRHHNWTQPIGMFKSLEETSEGLIAIGELSKSTDGNDALLDYQAGISREHSIGFNYISDKMNFIGNDEKGFWEIKEVFLWEGSSVTFGANSLTPTLDVSKGEHISHLEKINKEMSAITCALKEGKGTDDRLYSLEMRLKVVHQKYNSLINNVPFSNDTRKIDKPNNTPEELAQIKENKQKQFLLNLLK